MDEKLRETRQKGLDIPEVERIVFRTRPEDEEKQASDITELVDCGRAALGIMLDKMSGQTLILDTDYVKEAMDKRDTSKEELYKLAGDMDFLIPFLKKYPDLRQAIQRSAMSRHPLLKHFQWALKNPWIRRYADKRLYAKVQDYDMNGMLRSFRGGAGAGGLGSNAIGAGPATVTPDPIAAAKQRDAMATAKPGLKPIRTNFHAEDGTLPTTSAPASWGVDGGSTASRDAMEVTGSWSPDTKAANFAPGILTSLIGSSMAERQVDQDELARRVIELQRDEELPADPGDRAQSVELDAEDPQAQAYLAANRRKIRALLERLAQQGKI